MRACFHFDGRAWEEPAARHAIETVATLLETPLRIAAPGESAAPGEAAAWVGDPARAPADAAAVIPVTAWEIWQPADVALATFEGEPLPCPGGSFAPPASERELPGPWLRAIAFLLGREEETLDLRRDQWECFSGFYSRMNALGVLDHPLINGYAAHLERRIAAWAERRNVTLPRIPRWPDGARFAAVLSHDVDDVKLYSMTNAWRLLRQARDPRSYAMRAGVAGALRTLANGNRSKDPYWNFERWAAEETRHGFRSTFYVCPPHPSRRHEYDALYDTNDEIQFEGQRTTVGRMFHDLSRRGFEIGLHGSYHSHIDAAELELQRRQIEQATETEVQGIRQHFLRFNVRSTWAAQAAAGFRHDSTLGYNEAIGFRAGIAAPFRPWDPARRAAHALWELPLSVMDGALFRTLKLDAERAIERVQEHLDRVEKAGGMTVLLWHPNAADEEHFPGWWETYARTIEELARRRAWVTNARTMTDWWNERMTSLVENPSTRR